MAMTLAVEVMMITASTSMKLPNVSWPIESEQSWHRQIRQFRSHSVGQRLNPAAISMYFRAVGT
jgi:hypothetical protein